MKKINVAPSLICLDLCNLEKEVQDVERLGADMLHVDLLDGYFSPSMPIGLDVIRQVRQITDLPFDVHLMVVKNDFFLEELYNIGVQRISIHAEGTRHLDKTLAEIKMHGIEAGIALCPATPLHVLEFAKARCDFILHMMINPGYASRNNESVAPYAMAKLNALRQLLAEENLDITVDGHIQTSSIPELISNGATTLVLGTSSLLDSSSSREDNMRRIKYSITEGI